MSDLARRLAKLESQLPEPIEGNADEADHLADALRAVPIAEAVASYLARPGKLRGHYRDDPPPRPNSHLVSPWPTKKRRDRVRPSRSDTVESRTAEVSRMRDDVMARLRAGELRPRDAYGHMPVELADWLARQSLTEYEAMVESD